MFFKSLLDTSLIGFQLFLIADDSSAVIRVVLNLSAWVFAREIHHILRIHVLVKICMRNTSHTKNVHVPVKMCIGIRMRRWLARFSQRLREDSLLGLWDNSSDRTIIGCASTRPFLRLYISPLLYNEVIQAARDDSKPGNCSSFVTVTHQSPDSTLWSGQRCEC